MNWAHYRVILARLGVLAFGLLAVYLIGTVVGQASDISALTDRLAVEQARFRDQQTANDAAALARQSALLDGISTLKLAVGTNSSPEVQTAVNELLARVKAISSGPPGPTGPQGKAGSPGATGPAGVAGTAPTSTSTAPVGATSTTRSPTTTTTTTRPGRPSTTTTTTRCTVGLLGIKLGCT